jgi:hypothetical protein
MSGYDIHDTGRAGVMGVPDTANNPPIDNSLYSSWVDNNNNLWFYGGVYNSKMWRYNISTKEWTWMHGNTGNIIRGTKGVFDPNNTPGQRGAYAHWKDSQGNFWLLGGVKDYAYSESYNDLWKFDVSLNQWAWMHGTDTLNAWYVAHGFCNPDNDTRPRGMHLNNMCWNDNYGNFWMSGGYSFNSGQQYNYDEVWCYFPSGNQWALVRKPYSSSVSQPIYGTLGVPDTSNSPAGRSVAAVWVDSAGNPWMYGGVSHINISGGTGTYYKLDLWRYTPDSCAMLVFTEDLSDVDNSISVSWIYGTSEFKILTENFDEISAVYVQDINGRTIYILNGSDDMSFDMYDRQPGIYFCRIITTNNKEVIKKFTFVR